MPQLHDILTILEQFAYNALLLAVALSLSTLILEDAATVTGAVLVANGWLGLEAALLAIYSGIIIGDAALYALGRYASHSRIVQNLLKKPTANKAKTWIHQRLFIAVFSARFIPGMRLTTYTICGLFRFPFTHFILATALASCLWTTGLFSAAYILGETVFAKMDSWKWGIASVLIILLIFLPRLLVKGKLDNKQNISNQ